MGRPKEHDERTAQALLDAAERTVERDGVAALSLRSLAVDAGTSTRAVYSLFGSKDGLVTALGARAFELLREGLEELPPTGDPQRDLVDAALMFRRFALGHPVLFSIGIQRTLSSPEHWAGFLPVAMGTLEVLESRFERLAAAGLLAGRTTREAAFEFHALCEGLTTCELRGMPPSLDAERLWRDGIAALVAGLATAPRP
jgi:AcrR family transcriptional regulator